MREIREELGADITDVRLLGVLENIYSKADTDWHEIVFMFEARFADASLEEAERLVGVEGDGGSDRGRVAGRVGAPGRAAVSALGCWNCCGRGRPRSPLTTDRRSAWTKW